MEKLWNGEEKPEISPKGIGKKMEKIKTLPIGETFKYRGDTLQVVYSDRVCFACHFYEKGCKAMHNEKIGDCSKFFRTDFTDVIFKKI